MLVGIDGPKRGLKVVVVVVIPIVICVDNNIADVVERHEQKCMEVVGVKPKVSDSTRTT